MTLDEFTIAFDNPTKSFNPGQSVSGHVILSSTQETNTQGLKIKCDGHATVHWVETMGRIAGVRGGTVSSSEAPLPFDATEKYFLFEVYVVGNGETDCTIPPGRNEYPFNFVLPKGLPCSYVGSYGKVVYEISAALKRSWKFDKEVKEILTINTIVDLSLYPSVEDSVNRTASTQLCCCCCESGQIGFEITLPKTGFLPGECVTPTVRLFNESGRGINTVMIYMTQKQKFVARETIKAIFKTIAELKGPSLDPRETTIWNPVLQIPDDLPPTKLGGGSEIMDVQYAINCLLEPPVLGFASMPKEEISVIIGTVNRKLD